MKSGDAADNNSVLEQQNLFNVTLQGFKETLLGHSLFQPWSTALGS
jgi:hypothetical protein